MKVRLKAWGDSKIIAIAGCVLLNDAGELLFLKRHSEDLGGGQWGLPGGRLEPGEAAEAAIRREVYEETGLQLEALTPLGTHLIRMPHGTVAMTNFRAQLRHPIPSITLDPDEHEAYRWCTPAATLRDPDMLWGVPTILRDFGLLEFTGPDPTLHDGSTATLTEYAAGR